MTNPVLRLLAGITVATATTSAFAAAAPINGRWLTQDRDAIVEVGPCGDTICGRVAKFLVRPPQGNDQKDTKNPDPKLRNRRLLGMAVVYGLKADGNEWKGTIYDPKSGRSYRSVVYLAKNGTLKVKGCFGPICRGQNWTKSNL
jgi:uncharacterized protein (DUF2147 family)